MIPRWLWFGDTEIANATRVREYVRQAAPGAVVDLPCSECGDCPDLPDMLGQQSYLDPQSDPAPWYSDAVPASKDFLGFFPTSLEGVDTSTRTGDTLEGISDGGWVVGERLQTRQTRLKGVLMGRNQMGLDAGLAWLSHALDCAPGALCGQGQTLRYLVDCPSSRMENRDAFGLVPENYVTSMDPAPVGRIINRALNPRMRTVQETLTVAKNLITNPRMRSTNGTVVVDTNYFPDPFFERGTGGWSDGSLGTRRQVASPDGEGFALALTRTSSESGGMSQVSYPGSPAPSVPVGTTITFTCDVWIPSTNTDGTAAIRVSGTMPNSQSSQASDPNLRDQWQQLKVVTTTAQESGSSGPNLYGPGAAGEVFYFKNGSYTYGDVLPETNFSGDTQDGDGLTYSWEGTPGQSASIISAVRPDGMPVIQGGTGAAIWTDGSGQAVMRCGTGYTYCRPTFGNINGPATALVATVTASVDSDIYLYFPTGDLREIVHLDAGVPTAVRTVSSAGDKKVYFGWSAATAVPGATLTFDRFLVTPGEYRGGFFDGATQDDDTFHYVWDGTADDSTSRREGRKVYGWYDLNHDTEAGIDGIYQRGDHLMEITDGARAYMSPGLDAKPGQWWAYRLKARLSGGTADGSARFGGRCYANGAGRDGNVASRTVSLPADGSWVDVVCQSDIQATADDLNNFRAYMNEPADLQGGVLQFTDFLAATVDGPGIDPPEYFDGSTANSGGWRYQWTGTPDMSTSTAVNARAMVRDITMFTVTASVPGGANEIQAAAYVEGSAGTLDVSWRTSGGDVVSTDSTSWTDTSGHRAGYYGQVPSGAKQVVLTWTMDDPADVEKPTVFYDAVPVPYYDQDYTGADEYQGHSRMVTSVASATFSMDMLSLDGGRWVTPETAAFDQGGFVATPTEIKAGKVMLWSWTVEAESAGTVSLEIVSDGSIVKQVSLPLSAGTNTVEIDDDGLVVEDAYCIFRPTGGGQITFTDVELTTQGVVDEQEAMYQVTRRIVAAKPIEGPEVIADATSCRLAMREVDLVIASGSPETLHLPKDIVTWEDGQHHVQMPGASVEVLSGPLPTCVVEPEDPIRDPNLPPIPPSPDLTPPDAEVPDTYERSICVVVPAFAPPLLEAAPVITLTPTSAAVRDVRVRFVPGGDQDDPLSVDACNATGGFFVSYLPANYSIVVDSTTRSIYALNQDRERVQGSHLVSSDTGGLFEWPVIVGHRKYFVEIDSPDPGVGVTLTAAVRS